MPKPISSNKSPADNIDKCQGPAPKLAARLVSEASRAKAHWTVKDVDKPWNANRPVAENLISMWGTEKYSGTRSATSHHAARRVQRHIPVRRAKFWHQADLFGSAPAKDLPGAEARLDAISESDSVKLASGSKSLSVSPSSSESHLPTSGGRVILSSQQAIRGK